MKVYQVLAQTFNAYLNCESKLAKQYDENTANWMKKHRTVIQRICDKYLPKGSGFDAGTKFDFDNSKDNKLYLITSFHHMDENGYYCGWTEHNVIITPDLQFDFNIRITGRDKNMFKEYAYEQFQYMLNEQVDDNDRA